MNAFLPGTFWTVLVSASRTFAEPPPGAPKIPGIPINRWSKASEIADAALFLASDEASYITGVRLPGDSGYWTGYSSMAADRDVEEAAAAQLKESLA